MKTEGDLLKDNGMQQALDNENEAWKLQAILLMQSYCKTHEEFMGEDVNKWCLDQGLEQPHTPKVWGAIFKSALLKKGEERVKVIAYDKAKSVKSHSHVFPVYRSLSFPLPTASEISLTIREQIKILENELKFRKISVEEFTERLWGLLCSGNTRLMFLD